MTEDREYYCSACQTVGSKQRFNDKVVNMCCNEKCNRGVDLANPPRHCPECLKKKKKSKVKLKVFNGELKIFCKNEECCWIVEELKSTKPQSSDMKNIASSQKIKGAEDSWSLISSSGDDTIEVDGKRNIAALESSVIDVVGVSAIISETDGVGESATTSEKEVVGVSAINSEKEFGCMSPDHVGKSISSPVKEQNRHCSTSSVAENFSELRAADAPEETERISSADCKVTEVAEEVSISQASSQSQHSFNSNERIVDEEALVASEAVKIQDQDTIFSADEEKKNENSVVNEVQSLKKVEDDNGTEKSPKLPEGCLVGQHENYESERKLKMSDGLDGRKFSPMVENVNADGGPGPVHPDSVVEVGKSKSNKTYARKNSKKQSSKPGSKDITQFFEPLSVPDMIDDNKNKLDVKMEDPIQKINKLDVKMEDPIQEINKLDVKMEDPSQDKSTIDSLAVISPKTNQIPFIFQLGPGCDYFMWNNIKVNISYLISFASDLADLAKNWESRMGRSLDINLKSLLLDHQSREQSPETSIKLKFFEQIFVKFLYLRRNKDELSLLLDCNRLELIHLHHQKSISEFIQVVEKILENLPSTSSVEESRVLMKNEKPAIATNTNKSQNKDVQKRIKVKSTLAMSNSEVKNKSAKKSLFQVPVSTKRRPKSKSMPTPVIVLDNTFSGDKCEGIKSSNPLMEQSVEESCQLEKKKFKAPKKRKYTPEFSDRYTSAKKQSSNLNSEEDLEIPEEAWEEEVESVMDMKSLEQVGNKYTGDMIKPISLAPPMPDDISENHRAAGAASYLPDSKKDRTGTVDRITKKENWSAVEMKHKSESRAATCEKERAEVPLSTHQAGAKTGKLKDDSEKKKKSSLDLFDKSYLRMRPEVIERKMKIFNTKSGKSKSPLKLEKWRRKMEEKEKPKVYSGFSQKASFRGDELKTKGQKKKNKRKKESIIEELLAAVEADKKECEDVTSAVSQDIPKEFQQLPPPASNDDAWLDDLDDLLK